MIILVATAEEETFIKSFNLPPEYKILKTGVGGANVIETLKSLDKSEDILNIGYAGSNNLPIGSKILVDSARLYHPNVAFEEKAYPLSKEIPEIFYKKLDTKTFSNATCYTSNDFVLETKLKTPVVFDMELAFIAAFGFKSLASIKIVSDNLDLDKYTKTVSK